MINAKNKYKESYETGSHKTNTKSLSAITSSVWDVIVIGGGPAGMMAAGFAANRGAKTLLIEKNDTLGKKLRITGGGRCNITNNQTDNRSLLSNYGDAEKFLYSAFDRFDVSDALKFFHQRGVETKVENEGRVFPVSDSAETVWDAMVDFLKERGVEVLSRAEAVDILNSNSEEGILDSENLPLTSVKSISGIKIKDELGNTHTLCAKSYIVATGGKSRPETGSTGDGFLWLSKLGHNIVKPSASLVPLAIKDSWVKNLSGVTIDDIKLKILQNKIPVKNNILKSKCRVLFTHFGVSGPTILNISSTIKDLLKLGSVEIVLDLVPDMSVDVLDKYLVLHLSQNNKKIKNALMDLFKNIPAGVCSILLQKADIDEGLSSNSIIKLKRNNLSKLLKGLNMEVEGVLGADKAIVTSGGLELKEIDMKYMRSRLYNNLFVVGDMLNINRPSGGYSLQLCWTTGYIAGVSAADLSI